MLHLSLLLGSCWNALAAVGAELVRPDHSAITATMCRRAIEDVSTTAILRTCPRLLEQYYSGAMTAPLTIGQLENMAFVSFHVSRAMNENGQSGGAVMFARQAVTLQVQATSTTADTRKLQSLASYHAALGRIYEEQGNAIEALEHWERSIQIMQPLRHTDAAALKLYANTCAYKALQMRDLAKYEDAYRTLRPAYDTATSSFLQSPNEHAEAMHYTARTMAHICYDAQTSPGLMLQACEVATKAGEVMRKAHNTQPDDYSQEKLLGLTANALYWNGRLKETLDLINSAGSAVESNGEIQYTKANALAESGNTTSAISVYRSILAQDDSNTTWAAASALGGMLVNGGKTIEAIDVADFVEKRMHELPAEETPSFTVAAELAKLRGDAAYRWNDTSEARPYYESWATFEHALVNSYGDVASRIELQYATLALAECTSPTAPAEAFRQANKVLSEVMLAAEPKNRMWQQLLAEAHLIVAELSDSPAEKRKHATELLAILSDSGIPTDSVLVRGLRSFALALLGDLRAAREIADELIKQGIVAPAVIGHWKALGVL